MVRFALVIALLPAVAAADDLSPLTLSSQDEWLNKIAFGDLKSDLAYSVHAAVGAQAGRVTGVQGNAGGTIEKCEAPHLFEVTWEFGDGKSWVLVTIEAAGANSAKLTLEHRGAWLASPSSR